MPLTMYWDYLDKCRYVAIIQRMLKWHCEFDLCLQFQTLLMHFSHQPLCYLVSFRRSVNNCHFCRLSFLLYHFLIQYLAENRLASVAKRLCDAEVCFVPAILFLLLLSLLFIYFSSKYSCSFSCLFLRLLLYSIERIANISCT